MSIRLGPRWSLTVGMAGILIAIAFDAIATEAVKRTALKRVDLTGDATREIITTLLNADPGATVRRHSHHGDEVLYVLSGGLIQVPGKDPVRLETGQVLHFPRGMVHGGFEVVGDVAIKGLTIHVVDKDKPLAVPAE